MPLATSRILKSMFTRFSWRLFVGIALLVLGLAAALFIIALRALEVASDPGLVESARRGLWLWGSSAVLVVMAVALYFSQRIAEPLGLLAVAGSKLSSGKQGHRVVVRSQDELGALAASINAASERIEMETRSKAQDRTQLETVLSAMTDGVLAVDAQERVLHINQVAQRLLSIANAEDGLNDRPIVEVTREPHVLQAIQETIETGEEVHRSFTRGAAGQEERTLELTANVLMRQRNRSEDDECAGAVVVLHDVTRIEQLEGVRRDFVSNVSHELKTPLTAIRGFVETLLDVDDVDDDTRRRFLSRIKIQTTRLSDLVGNLLSLSRIESGRVQTPDAPLDARDVVSDVLNALKTEIDARRIQLSFEPSEQAIPVLAEAEQLRQAFSNLVSNAVKYSEAGAKVAVRLFIKQDEVVFEVEDSGPGIAQEQLARIFERFYRVDKARSRDLGGTGLGLAIVKNVANALGGRVEVESEVGEGSQFRIVVPVSKVLPVSKKGPALL